MWITPAREPRTENQGPPKPALEGIKIRFSVRPEGTRFLVLSDVDNSFAHSYNAAEGLSFGRRKTCMKYRKLYTLLLAAFLLGTLLLAACVQLGTLTEPDLYVPELIAKAQ